MFQARAENRGWLVEIAFWIFQPARSRPYSRADDFPRTLAGLLVVSRVSPARVRELANQLGATRAAAMARSLHTLTRSLSLRELELGSEPLAVHPRKSGGAKGGEGCSVSILNHRNPRRTHLRLVLGGFLPCRLRVSYFKYSASQSRKVLYQSWLFCGFNTQCPSSGKITSFDGTACARSAVKNSKSCVYGTR
jgi:hypothetical protein